MKNGQDTEAEDDPKDRSTGVVVTGREVTGRFLGGEALPRALGLSDLGRPESPGFLAHQG